MTYLTANAAEQSKTELLAGGGGTSYLIANRNLVPTAAAGVPSEVVPPPQGTARRRRAAAVTGGGRACYGPQPQGQQAGRGHYHCHYAVCLRECRSRQMMGVQPGQPGRSDAE